MSFYLWCSLGGIFTELYEDVYEVSVDPKGVELVVPEGEVNGGTHTHSYTCECMWDKYKVEGTDDVYYKSCAVCGAASDSATFSPYGSFEFITTDGENPVTSKIDENGVKTTSYRFTSPDKLQWYPANSSIGRYQEGYWIGFKIIAPSSVTSEVLNETGKPVQYMTSSDGGNTWSAVKSFTQNKDCTVSDGRYYMGAWVPTNHSSIVKFAEYGVDMKWIYKFDWNKDGVYEDVYEVSVDPKGVELVVPEGEVNGGTHTHGAGIKCTWDKYKVEGTDGVYYKSCEVCGAALEATFADPIKVTTKIAGIELYKNDVKIEDLANTTFVKDDVLKIAIADGYRLAGEDVTVGDAAAVKNDDGTYSYTFTGEEATTPLAVVAEVVKLYTVTFTDVKVKNGEVELASGDKVDEGTVLTVEAVAKEGYTAKVLVNDEELTGNTVTVTEDVTIKVEYTRIAQKVQNVNAVADYKQVALTWDKNPDASKYRIRRNDGTGWTTLATIADTAYTDASVEAGKTYRYAVIPYVDGKFDLALQSDIVVVEVKAAPVVLSAEVNDNAVSLSWTEITGATKYRIRRNNGSGWTTLATITGTTYTDSTVESGKTYSYVVIPYVNDAFDISRQSEAVKVEVKAAPIVLNAEVKGNTVSLSWTENADATKYRIRRNDGAGWTTLATITGTTYTDSTVESGKTYSYVVIPYVNDAFDISRQSEAVKVEVKAEPIVLNAEVKGNTVSLSWTEITGATKYRIRRNTGSGWTTLATITGTTYTDSTVESGKTYSYVVIPYVNDAFDISRQSEAVKVEVKADSISLVVTVQANTVTVYWNEVAGATKYRIRRNDGTGWTTMQTSAKTSFVDTTAQKGKRYTYVVYPYINDAFADPSQTVKVSLVGSSTSAAITVVTTGGQTTISWAKIAGVKKYRVRRNDGTKWQTMASTANLSWTDTTAESGKTYTYVVYISTDGVNYTDPSSTITLNP